MKEVNTLIFFIQAGKSNKKLKATHISIYLALFCSWRNDNYHTPFKISRSTIMDMAKIRSMATYHKCIREISEWGLIEYSPSYDRFIGTQVRFLNLSKFKTQ